MIGQLAANLRINALYFIRNGGTALALGLGLFLLFNVSDLYQSLTQETDSALETALREFLDISKGICRAMPVISGAAMILLFHTHFRDRNVKMILTRPCNPAVWLASAYISVAVLSGAILAVNYAVLSAVLLLAGIPPLAEPGYLALMSFSWGLAAAANAMWLMMIFKGWTALFFAGLLNIEAIVVLSRLVFHDLLIKYAGPAVDAAGASLVALYFVLPDYYFGFEYTNGWLKMEKWKLVIAAAGYPLVCAALSICLSIILLRRKNLS